MKRLTLTHILPFLVFIVLPSIWTWYLYQLSHIPGSDIIMPCKTPWSKFQRYHYVGPTLLSNSNDSSDQILCPGDTFGDPNNTHVTVKNCYLEMYHQEKLLWSSKPNIHDPQYTCAFALQRDGNGVLYREASLYVSPIGERIIVSPQWDSQTNFNPTKTELRLQHQQLQIVQTFKDGSERLFYVDAENQEFREDMGEPRKVANRFVLKKTQDKDKTILRKNEYIGDLDGTHLILQSNCHLQLLNKNQILWSIAPTFRHERNCVLSIDEKHQIAISKITPQGDFLTQRITQFDDDEYSDIIENWIMFEDDQPTIIQTLKNGSEIIYTSGVGQNHGLKLKRNPRQLAKETLNISLYHRNSYTIERMDYIGDLTGFHLILQQNCSLMLNNRNQNLWELQPKLHDEPLMDCLIRFGNYGKMILERRYSTFYEGGLNILRTNYDENVEITGYQFTLENNQLIVTRQLIERAPETFIAGANLQGTFFQIVSESPVVVNSNDKDDLTLPKMGIGNINGVYAIFEDDCNWVLYNKTEVIWESGTSRKELDRECTIILMRDGRVMVTSPWSHQRKDYLWSTQNTVDLDKDVLKAKLLVNNDGLWLIHTYTDGTGKMFKALEGTNSFIHVPNGYSE